MKLLFILAALTCFSIAQAGNSYADTFRERLNKLRKGTTTTESLNLPQITTEEPAKESSEESSEESAESQELSPKGPVKSDATMEMIKKLVAEELKNSQKTSEATTERQSPKAPVKSEVTMEMIKKLVAEELKKSQKTSEATTERPLPPWLSWGKGKGKGKGKSPPWAKSSDAPEENDEDSPVSLWDFIGQKIAEQEKEKAKAAVADPIMPGMKVVKTQEGESWVPS